MNGGKHLLKITRVLAMLAVIISVPFVGYAQTATINGTVTDPTGAVVPHAKVTAVNAATNAVRDAETGDTGTYTLSNLPPGIYDVTMDKVGLKSVKFSAVKLTVDQALTLDVKMEISSTAQTVTVEGTNVVTVNTTDAQVSNVIDSKQIQDLPLILRDPYQLVLLTPGSTKRIRGSADSRSTERASSKTISSWTAQTTMTLASPPEVW